MVMSSRQKFIVRCRGIILHEGKLLVVRHAHDPSFAALPGGHLEWGEDAHTCIRREILEELGIEPVIGRLLYINTFHATRDGETVQPFEFFFEVTNGDAYLAYEDSTRSHAHELADVSWITSDDDVHLLPEEVMRDFKAGRILADSPRYINNLPSIT
jgi:ADP-ribose pyrophosphatase YjhB (NUDIX family)